MKHVVSLVCLGLMLSMVVTVTTGKPGLCQLPPKTGLCRARVPRFYYNAAQRECQSFTYGGCGGNDNRFQRLEECNRACRPVDTCQQPNMVGMCRAAIPRWYYDTTTRHCQLFIYGGCGGNDNNFATKQQCVQRCDFS